MNSLLIYLWLKLDAVIILLVVISGTLLLFYPLLTFLISLEVYDEKEFYKKWFKKKVIIIGIISLLFAVFLPSSKQVAIIYVAPKVVNSKVVKEDIPEIYNYGMEALKEQMKTLINNEDN